MSQINVLDISVANLIAAGEVVERPSSALKELCENSIDAGAKNITVEIKSGGVALMRVTDDGCGMTGEDAVLSVKRHATSKIKTEDDLRGVMTLGFRGEALAAITAVTHTRILTKRAELPSGTAVEVDYGTLSSVSEGGYPDGTTVICEQLFAHTPARLKFLKSDSAEGALCLSAIEKLALSHPEVAFKFISDGNIRFQSVGDGKLKNAIYSVLGRDFAGKLCEVDSESDGVRVSGYVGTPDNVRGNRGMELFFINHRCVRSVQLMTALETAFKSFAPIGKYPVCVLNISIDAALVDVNVHPSKLEVKFSDEKLIFDAVYYSVRGALERNLQNPELPKKPEPKMTEEKLKIISAFMPIDSKAPKQTRFDLRPAPEKTDIRPKMTEETGGKASDFPKKIAAGYDFPSEPASDVHTAKLGTDAEIVGFQPRPVPEYRILGEAFCCYVIVELEDRIYLIDKHAAHERINFEKMKANMTLSSPDVQTLLIPERIPLSHAEADCCEKYKSKLASIGFAFEIRERGAEITGIPAGTELAESKALFAALVGMLSHSDGALDIESKNYFEQTLYQSACKASVKAGRKYDDAHVKWIIDNFFRYDCIRRCPHGRPVAMEMTKRELDTRFGRIK